MIFYKYTVMMMALGALVSTANAASVSTGEVFETDTARFITKKIEECQPATTTIKMSDGEKMSCKTKEKIRLGLGITSITLTTASVGAMCSTVLAPFSVAIAGASAGAQFLDFIMDKVECFDKEADERNKQLIKQQVCEAFIKKGVDCDPSLL